MLTLPPRGTIDFETRSQCDLRTHGSWRYALDPTTEVLCMAFRVPTWPKGRTGLWHPAFPHLEIVEGELGGPTVWEDIADLFAWIDSEGLIEAHNAWFERGIWTYHMRPVCPAIQPHQWRCSAAKSAAHALPRALGNVASVLETTEQKDSEGEKVMKKMTKPRKPTKQDLMLWYRRHVPCQACRGVGTRQERKKDGTPKAKRSKCKTCKGTGHGQDVSRVPAMPVLYHETRELLEQLFDYCRQDVLSEEAVSLSLPDLDPKETELYLLDQTINERGFQLDVEAVDSALALLAKETEALNGEIAALTRGQVEKGTQRQRMMGWFKEHGLDLPDTQKGTIQALLDSTTKLSDDVRRALDLMRQLGQSSTAKYQTMKRWMCPDGRVRGGLLFHGASTGRWSGAGVQPHNFVKGKIKDMATLWDVLKNGTREEVMELYGTVMDALSSALRGVIIAAPGHRLFVADYASIEARVLLWLAEDEESLGIFRRGEDIYLSMAKDIYGRTCTKADVKERSLGKIAVLGLGYQMGASRFVDTCKVFHIDIIEDRECSVCGIPSRQHRPSKRKRFNHIFTSDCHDVTAVQIVDAYRERFWQVKQLWQDMEEAAIEATENPEAIIPCGRVSWQYHRGFLYCTLPSGRKLAYPDPEVETRPQAWGGSRPALTFMGVNAYTHQWQRQATYGGMLVENCLAGDTPVLTSRGWVEIRDVTTSDLLWDGLGWVAHGGVLAKGVQDTLTLNGIRMTPNHQVLTTKGWQCASSCEGLNGATYRFPNCYPVPRIGRPAISLGRSLRLWVRDRYGCQRISKGASEVLWLSDAPHASNVQSSRLSCVAQYARQMPATFASGVAQLWRTGHQGVQAMGRELRGFLGGYGGCLSTGIDVGPNRQQRPVFSRELPMDNAVHSELESSHLPVHRVPLGESNRRRGFPLFGNRGHDAAVSSRRWMASTRLVLGPGFHEQVYDILNAGPLNRFTVLGNTGPIVVHNCTQAVARDLMAEAMLRCEASGVYAPILSVHDEVLAEAKDDGPGTVKAFEQLVAEVPTWATGLPVAADGWSGYQYRK